MGHQYLHYAENINLSCSCGATAGCQRHRVIPSFCVDEILLAFSITYLLKCDMTCMFHTGLVVL